MFYFVEPASSGIASGIITAFWNLSSTVFPTAFAYLHDENKQWLHGHGSIGSVSCGLIVISIVIRLCILKYDNQERGGIL